MASDVFGLVGTAIENRFRVDAVIGEGGFGVVYRGFHLSLKQPIAIKCLKVPPHFTQEAKTLFLERFQEEAAILAKLSESPSIVRVFDLNLTSSGESKTIPYLVLEWLQGRDLESILEERRRSGSPPYSEREAVETLRPVVEAVALAHSHRIAHRDLKPANIFMCTTAKGTVPKVLDFGIAKAMQEGDSATQVATRTSSGFSAFSPQYGAPEQFRSKKFGATGPWTDVHALGLILSEMTSGRRPLDGDDVVDLLEAATAPLRPTPRVLGAAVSDAFEELCRKAIQVDPRSRFRDAGELGRALDALAPAPIVASRQQPVNVAPAPAATPIKTIAAEPVALPTSDKSASTPAIEPQAIPVSAGMPAGRVPPAPRAAASQRRSAAPFIAIGALVSVGGVAAIVASRGASNDTSASASAQLSGNPATASADGLTSPTPSGIAPAANQLVEVDADLRTTCARTYGGELLCIEHAGPYRVADIADTVAFDLGLGIGCARLRDDALKCFKLGSYMAHLGDGNYRTSEKDRDTVLVGDIRAKSISVGTHSCAALTNGTVRCWGKNTYGQLGVPSKEKCGLGDFPEPCNGTPTEVIGLSGIEQVATGGDFTCARAKDGGVHCWGYNARMELGAPSSDSCRYTAGAEPVPCGLRPQPVPGLDDVVQVAAGSHHACAVKRTGSVWCWGSNNEGQLGASPASVCEKGSTCAFHPISVEGLTDVSEVLAGGNASCALLKDGSVLCWGANEVGQLGDGTTKNRPRPAPVSGLRDVAHAAMSYNRNCAVTQKGDVYCWGYGAHAGGLVGADKCTPAFSSDMVSCALKPVRIDFRNAR